MTTTFLDPQPRGATMRAIRRLRILALAFVVSAIMTFETGCLRSGVHATGPAESPPSTSLFNGSNLDGWRVYGTELWYVEDGELVCESGPDKGYGYLATIDEYTDFDLALEFLQSADGNSGVFFRSSIEGTRISGWQAEIAPPGSHTGGVYESYGRGWLARPDPELDDVLRMGAWNTMRVRVVGDRVTTWLNGIEMVNFTDSKIGEAAGSIALQIHDGGGIKVRWRNLRIAKVGGG